jgi:hypothetical protein
MKKLLLFFLLTLTFSFAQTLSEDEARQIIDGIYKGDYREAFVSKNPELF